MADGLLPRALDFGMAAFGERIEWSDCASEDPSEWSYGDVEVFYAAGRCHHLALALHRQLGHRICVLFENDPEWLEREGRPLPHHVFALDRDGHAVDVRGTRPIGQVLEDFAGTVGVSVPGFVTFGDEAAFRRSVLDRDDRPLCAADEVDVERAGRLIPRRLGSFAEDHARIVAAFRDEAALARGSGPRP